MTRNQSQVQQPSVALTVSADKPGVDIAPTMIGLFIEDINFNGDGGLYAELVKNRSFEFPDNIMGWLRVLEPGSAGYMYIEKRPDKQVNPHYMRMDVQKIGQGFGLSNEGYRGMGIRQGEQYRFSVYARTDATPKSLKIQVLDPDEKVLLEGKLENIQGDWKHYDCLMEAKATHDKARLNVLALTEGVLDLDTISLFPEKSARQMHGRSVPGLRQDLVDTLAAVKPGFLRFPGGCIVEGKTLGVRYQWKKTIGDINERQTLINRWNTEFAHRPTLDYFQSFGLGFYEYFLLSEQVGAEPMPIINCGMACQFNSGEMVDIEKLQPYVQDALDLIEFANGPADCKWGAKRAEMGHPEPFNMKYLGVGNEQWGPQYIERYKIFEKALKEKYPDVKLIAGCGSDATIFPNGPAEIDYLWSQYRKLKPDIVDEHFYRHYPWFFENANYYDNYDPEGPEVFIGEYSAMTHGVPSPENCNNLIVALAEAAFITGVERNAAVVTMSAYAPLAGHVDAWQWKPNLLWFDNLTSYATPSYYVQQMFSLYTGDKVLPIQSDVAKGKLFTTASLDSDTGCIYLKAVNPGGEPVTAAIRLEGMEKLSSKARVITLAGQPDDENSIAEPKNIAPVEKTVELKVADSQFDFTIHPYSLTVIELKP